MILYRYEMIVFERREECDIGIAIECKEYEVLKETREGYWIKTGGYAPCTVLKKKWVSKVTKKRFAYIKKEDALKSFIRRRERYIVLLEERLNTSKRALDIANEMKRLGEYK